MGPRGKFKDFKHLFKNKMPWFEKKKKKGMSKMKLLMISPPEKFYHFIKLIYLFKLPLKLFYIKKKIKFNCIHYTRGKITRM